MASFMGGRAPPGWSSRPPGKDIPGEVSGQTVDLAVET
jgi:hypothetical protein